MNPTAQVALSAATDLLSRFLPADLAPDERAALTQALCPRDEDYASAFLPPHAERVRVVYQGLWALRPAPSIAPTPGQTLLRLAVASAEELATGQPAAAEFPGGYREIGALLAPGSLWVSWHFLAPGESAGLLFDGLCYLGAEGRFAWFPKPWRALRAL